MAANIATAWYILPPAWIYASSGLSYYWAIHALPQSIYLDSSLFFSNNQVEAGLPTFAYHAPPTRAHTSDITRGHHLDSDLGPKMSGKQSGRPGTSSLKWLVDPSEQLLVSKLPSFQHSMLLMQALVTGLHIIQVCVSSKHHFLLVLAKLKTY